MGNIAQKLQNIIDSKAAISAAIQTKGGTVPTELTGYGAAIEALPSGGGSSDVAAKIVDRSITEVTAADLSGVTSIGQSAFSGCSRLTSIMIPDSVTSIGNSAFSNCSSLSSITIPSAVSSIGEYGFQYSGLTSISIPNGVPKISNYTFYHCNKLTSITIPSSVTSIGMFAFNGCNSCLIFDFSSATAVPTLANTVAFGSTNANKKIIVPDALYDSWKAANNWNSSTNGIVDAITKASEA